jgi:hypothetical protein
MGISPREASFAGGSFCTTEGRDAHNFSAARSRYQSALDSSCMLLPRDNGGCNAGAVNLFQQNRATGRFKRGHSHGGRGAFGRGVRRARRTALPVRLAPQARNNAGGLRRSRSPAHGRNSANGGSTVRLSRAAPLRPWAGELEEPKCWFQDWATSGAKIPCPLPKTL